MKRKPLRESVRVLCYFNLHRDQFSIKERYGRGLVIDHRDVVKLKDVTFKVWEGGRQRTIRTGHKNVHGFVEGTLLPDDDPEAERAHRPFGYNPMRGAHFYDKGTGDPMFGAAVALLKVVDGRPVCLAG